MMKEYKLPSGKASIETTGGLFATTEYTVPANASERNKALHTALTECPHLSAQCGQLQLQRDIERESVKQLTAERDALSAFRDEVVGIMNNSQGVAGWHQNGAIATWDELLPDVPYETEYLMSSPANAERLLRSVKQVKE